MKLRSVSRRWAARGTVAAVTAVTLAAGMQAAATAAVHRAASATPDPYSPAYHHPYRHGFVPTRPVAAKMRSWAAQHPAAAAGSLAFPRAATSGGPQLTYGGGNPSTGVGVTTGAPKVYLVFWGSQWGTASTDGNGNTVFTNDPSGEAPYLQQFLRGLGTNGERWSGVMTQYCDGVSTGAASCPGGSAYVGYPTGGALAGVWADVANAAPQQATANQIGAEAVAAAHNFSNTTAASNRNVQYVIVSPTGTNPDDWENVTTGFCAWHDWTGDDALDNGSNPPSAVPSDVGDVAFTNLPYQTDAGASCGQNFVNPGTAGTLDGVSIVEGHEYAETITDQEPGTSAALPYGWFDSVNGGENGDICAWFPPGNDGGSTNLATANGTYAVQTTWANDSGVATPAGCEGGHALNGVTSTNTVTVTAPATRSSSVGTGVNFTVTTTDSDSGQTTFAYSATGLPPGTSLSRSTGTITGTPSVAGVYRVTVAAEDGAGSTGSASFTWTVNAIKNPGFESGVITPWTSTSGVLQKTSTTYPAHSGSWLARLDGKTAPHTDTLSQKIKIPANNIYGTATATFSFYLRVVSNAASLKAADTLKVQILNSSGTVLKTLATYSNKNAGGYAKHSFSLSSYLGKTIIIKFTGKQTLTGHKTAFLVDDNLLSVH